MSQPELRRSATVEIQAPPLVVYDTVRRLERMGEWSPEATGGRWVEGDGTRVGDRFEGHNRRNAMEWTLPVVVNATVPGEVFAFHTGSSEQPLAQWTYEMEPTEHGTVVTERWELLEPELFVDMLGAEYPTQRSASVAEDLVTTLTNLKASIERS